MVKRWGMLWVMCAVLAGCMGAADDDETQVVDEVSDQASALELVRTRPELRDRVFVAELSGAQEVPSVQGDAQGFAVFVFDRAHRKLVFGLRHNLAAPTAGHIHLGSAGENGAVAVALPHFGDGAIGQVQLNGEQVEALRAGRLYVNLHSAAHPMGEMRGQILRPGERLFVGQLSGAQETPPIETAARGSAAFVLSAAKDSVHYRITSSGLTPTVVHVHSGPVGTAGSVVFEITPAAAMVEGDQALTAAQVHDLEAGLFYVNLHSAAHVKGELRGQLEAR
jgi:CHRD domain